MSIDLPARLAVLDAWLAKNVPAMHANLRPGASDAQLDALERHMRLKLPKDFRTLYKWHDGEQSPIDGGTLILNFIPLDDVRSEWDLWKELEPEFRKRMDTSRIRQDTFGRSTSTQAGWPSRKTGAATRSVWT